MKSHANQKNLSKTRNYHNRQHLQVFCEYRWQDGESRKRAAFPQSNPLAFVAQQKLQQMKTQALSYKDAGVDIDAGNELVKRIKKINPNIGGFNGMFPFGDSYLVSGTDGVGTKLKIAFDMNIHNTVGIDLVAMSVNDILTSGAKPLFFLDYFATGKLDVDMAEQVVTGIVKGCEQSECQLLGGETAEMPDFYTAGEYDLAGFAVGAVAKSDVVDGSSVKPGDVVLGLPSSGVHSNGFSLVRKVLERGGVSFKDDTPWGAGSFGEVLLEPTVIYVKDIMKAMDKSQIKAMCHITGGGLYENLPRVVPKNMTFQIQGGSWEVPQIFQWVQKTGGIAKEEMYRTFNMGVGFVLVVDQQQVEAVQSVLPTAKVIGSITEGTDVVIENI